ncbi:hypothetical protein [Paenibacillus peoriae]|uniref:hypothetical protein n=1 Tax=Paenibacillus peoriae TaxID=59893 RepID=UPI00117E1961|nr:hypothetical protein [Paenibacillus peoriae]
MAKLPSKDEANLDSLFAGNPKAQTLVQWSPFVVVVDDGQRLGVYDPRFYRKGQSFLYEFMCLRKPAQALEVMLPAPA